MVEQAQVVAGWQGREPVEVAGQKGLAAAGGQAPREPFPQGALPGRGAALPPWWPFSLGPPP